MAKSLDPALLGYDREIFSPEHDAFRVTARRFFADEVEPHIKDWEREGRFPRDLFT